MMQSDTILRERINGILKEDFDFNNSIERNVQIDKIMSAIEEETSHRKTCKECNKPIEKKGSAIKIFCSDLCRFRYRNRLPYFRNMRQKRGKKYYDERVETIRKIRELGVSSNFKSLYKLKMSELRKMLKELKEK